ncbi:MAG TPA: flagellar basal-body rod protein FlgF [Syntrophales bacterium]|nr:flagellar basal-body rod protein FlgF [Syntrophales bacterium]
MAVGGIGELVDATNRVMPRLDSIANNISNMGTSGFKADRLYYLKEKDPSSGGAGMKTTPLLVVDFSQGSLAATGNPLDLAVKGDGFFVVKTKNGEAYTRKGNFTVNKNNELVTQDGDLLVGESGKITLNGNNVVVSENGEVSVDGNRVGKLKIVKFAKPSLLVRDGNGLFSDPGGAGLGMNDKPEVQAGFLEMSNVQSIREMVEMINVQRTVDIYQKGIQTISEQDKLSTSRVGRVG